MSDERLRRLERRWMESGGIEDEIPYLREQLRVGHLARFKLELAAKLQDPAARAIIEDDSTDFDYTVWMTALSGFSRVFLVRVALNSCFQNWPIEEIRNVYGIPSEDARILSEVNFLIQAWATLGMTGKSDRQQIHQARCRLHQIIRIRKTGMGARNIRRGKRPPLPSTPRNQRLLALVALCDLVMEPEKKCRKHAAKIFCLRGITLSDRENRQELVARVFMCSNDPGKCAQRLARRMVGPDNPLYDLIGGDDFLAA